MTTQKEPENLIDLISEMEKLEEKIKSSSKNLLGKAFSNFFEKCPEVSSVVWTQYAPYFNDGEPCIFGVREPEFKPTNKKDYHEYDEDEYDDCEDYGHGDNSMLHWNPEKDTEEQKRIRKLWNETVAPAFRSEASSIMQHAFGDDCQVRASREGFSVSSYEHD